MKRKDLSKPFTILGIFDWPKVKDPKNEIQIEYAAFDRIEEHWDQQDVQDLFDELGVRNAVMYLNREYLIRHDKYALELDDENLILRRATEAKK